MELPNEVDVLIVGAGPVGATMANLCGRLGVRTLIIDKLPEISNQPRALALDNEALRILQLSGLDDTSFARLVVPEVRLHSPIFGQFARMNTGGLLDGFPRLITFFQPELEHALNNALARYPLVHLVRPLEWIETRDEGAGCLVSLRSPDGNIHQVQSRFVVAADGGSSAVRHALKMGFGGSSYKEDWLIVDMNNVCNAIGHVEFLCDPHRPVAHIPGPGGRQRWEFMLNAGESPHEMLRDESIRTLLGSWAEANSFTIERTAVYRFHARIAKSFRCGRTMLAGDAAHLSPPFSGQGLVSGLRDAANLAWKLAWVVQGRASEHILDSYDTERRPHAWAMTMVSMWMGTLIMPRNRLAAFLSHGFARLVTLTPWLRSLIVDIKLKPKNRFKRGLFTARRAPSRFQRGNHFAQGRLSNRDGKTLLSDEVLGQHFQLVGIGIDPLATLSAAGRDIWRELGGVAISIGTSGSAAWRDVDDTFRTRDFPSGWIVAVRPDKVIMAEGKPDQVDAIVNTVANLLR